MSNPPNSLPQLRFILALLMCCVMMQRAHGQQRLPNVVLLLSDDLGWHDIGCYGGPVETPHLDRLAAEGMRFSNFYSGAAVCSPSRAVLLTGRTNLRSGIYSWINDNEQRTHLPKRELTLAEHLKANGYATAHFGKWHLGTPSSKYPNKANPNDHGFDDWFATANNANPSHHNPNNFVRNNARVGPLEGYACDLVVDEAIHWLSSQSQSEAPFFLNVWFHEPHAPLAAPPDLVERYGDLSDPAAIYSATIANTDRAIGRLLDKLQGIGQPDDTLIIYSSDNGSYRADRVGHLRGTKGSNYEGGIRVPGIFHWPKHIQAGARTSEPAGLVDILATVCGLVGLKQPSVQLDGSDLSNFLTGVTNKVTRKQPLFWFLPLAGPAVAMRDGRYSMVAYRDGIIPKDHAAIAAIKQQIEALLRNRGTFETETRGSTFAKQLFEGFADRDAEKLRGQFIRLNQFHESWIPKLKQGTFTRFELYDLQQDPSQKRNLSTQFPRLHARMKADLQRIAASAMQEAFDWSAGQPIPDQAVDPAARVHRLQSTFRSPFDAFLYLNRIPTDTESGETSEDLAGRILGRLANQEGRILVKLPPGMGRSAYQGFKIALENDNQLHAGGCLNCHRLPHLGKPISDQTIPSLRNDFRAIEEFKAIMADATHRGLAIDQQDLQRLHAFTQTLTDVSDADFRNLILQAAVLDTSGELE